MIVAELINKLKTFPQEAQVRVTWESVVETLDNDQIYISKSGVVLIDGDGNSYKELFVSGKMVI